MTTLLVISHVGMAEVLPPEKSATPAAWSFSPHVSTALAIGGSTVGDELLEQSGHHDPHNDGFNMQALEVGGRLDFGQELSLVAIYNQQWDRDEKWDGHWEEAYMNFRLLPSLSIQTGLQLTPFGRENDVHVHGRDFVQSPLANTRFLGEDGFLLQGVSFLHVWGDHDQHSFVWGGGSVFAHEHEHEQGEHDEPEESALHAEEGLIEGNALQARWQSRFGRNQYGISGIVG